MMEIIIRADATKAIGTGHVMRCLALAQAAKAQNIHVHMIGKIHVPWVQKRLVQENIPYTFLPENVHAQEDPVELLTHIKPTGPNTWVVLDGYHFNLDCQKAVQNEGCKLLVIDDYAHLPEYSCHILLNQNLGAENLPYKGTIDTKLLGSQFVLLRQEFLLARESAKRAPTKEQVQNILISLGGGDFSKHLQKIAPYFIQPDLQEKTIRIIAGAMPLETIKTCFTHCPAKIEILETVDDMPALLLDTDLCITAGGSTCWELCCLGVPFLAIEVAENQHIIIQQLQKQKIAQPFSLNSLRKKISTHPILNSSDLGSSIDGLGAQRILSQLYT